MVIPRGLPSQITILDPRGRERAEASCQLASDALQAPIGASPNVHKALSVLSLNGRACSALTYGSPSWETS